MARRSGDVAPRADAAEAVAGARAEAEDLAVVEAVQHREGGYRVAAAALVR